ncbi:MAG: glycosyltransferase family 4 protein [Acidobacteriota bacterium]
MHVAYLHYLYGADTALHHVRQFAEAARDLGHRVDVHAMNLAPPPQDGGGPLPASARLRQALKQRFGRYLHTPKELLWNLRYIGKETDLLRRDPPDVLLVRHHDLGISCVPVTRRLGLPLVLEINAPAEESRRYHDEHLHWPSAQEWAGRFKIRRAEAIVTVSSYLATYLSEHYSVGRERITVAANGADLERFRPDTPPDDAFPRREATPRIAFVGSFQKFHGLDLLAEMVCRVVVQQPSARFLFVGGGAGAEDLQHRVGHTDRVDFTGQVPHERVPALLASADIAVIAEAAPHQCPLKLIEFMAAGKAIVAPHYEPIAELLRNGTEGLLFPPRDTDTLVQQLVDLAADPLRRRELGDAAAQRAHSSLAWTDNARKVLAACDAARARHQGRVERPR